MDYYFDADSWGASFSFPWSSAGGHIKSCSEAQIKILLYILAGARCTSSDLLAQMSGYTAAEVDDAVAYWQSAGVLRVNRNVPEISQNAPELPYTFSGKNAPVSLVESVKPAEKKVGKEIRVRYSQREMLEKIENDKALKNLMSGIQSLQFSINGNEQAKLIELYELYKFDAPSILLAADYCLAAGKRSIAYLYTVMVNCYNEGVQTFADVEAYIIESNERKSFENKVLKIFGIEDKPSEAMKKHIAEWKKQGFNLELIEIAFNKCMDNKNKLSFKYIDAILRNWASGGITSAEQAEKADQQYKDKRTARQEGDKPSFDLSDYESFAMNLDLSKATKNKRKEDSE